MLTSSVYKYTADGSNTVRGSSREGRVSNVERSVDDVVSVSKAIARMFSGGMSWGAVSLSPEMCREIFVMRHAGRPAFSSKRRECVRRIDASVDDVIEVACKHACGCGFRESVCSTFTRRHMSLVMKQGNAGLTEALVLTGELAPRKVAL